MPKIRYVGSANIRVFNSGDLKTFGVDSPELLFHRGQDVEAHPEVAAALLTHLADEFCSAEPPYPSEAGSSPADKEVEE